jgi:hypothetical protein
VSINDAIRICNEIREAESKTCSHCNGTGKIPELEAVGMEKCVHCHGKGKVQDFCPRIITKVEIQKEIIRSTELMGKTKRGDWVAVRPCGEEYGDKTYLGIYLGDLPLGIQLYAERDHTLSVLTHQNPAMYVPDLKEIIWGCGSWWHKIDKPEQLEEITDKDISNVWYVKALKEMGAIKEKEKCQDQ